MKVQDIMALPALTCPASTPLTAASRRMANYGCGSLVVLDTHGALAGIVTDRDLALAIGRLETQTTTATVESVMTRKVHVCREDDEVCRAIEAMGQHKVRRLPVIGRDGGVIGMLSIDDVILWGLQDGVTVPQLIGTLRRICSAEAAPLCDRLEA